MASSDKYYDWRGKQLESPVGQGSFNRVPMLGYQQVRPQQTGVDNSFPIPRPMGMNGQSQGATGMIPQPAPSPVNPNNPFPQPSQPNEFDSIPEPGGYQPPESKTVPVRVPSQIALDLFNTVRGMSGSERMSYLTSIRNNLTQRLQRYQELQARGFGGEMDDTAKMDMDAIKKSLMDITKMIDDPSYLDSLMRMDYSRQRGTGLVPGEYSQVARRPNENASSSSMTR